MRQTHTYIYTWKLLDKMFALIYIQVKYEYLLVKIVHLSIILLFK